MGERDGLSEWHCNAFRVQLLLHFPDIATFTKSAKLHDTFHKLHAMSSGRGVFDWHCNACRVQLVVNKKKNKIHIQAIRNNKPNSKYSQHILDTQRTYNTIEKTMKILQYEKEGPIMNTLEGFHVYNLSKQKPQMNDTCRDLHNPIFDLVSNRYKTSTLGHDPATITYQPPTPKRTSNCKRAPHHTRSQCGRRHKQTIMQLRAEHAPHHQDKRRKRPSVTEVSHNNTQ
jgi:hypothetical protein